LLACLAIGIPAHATIFSFTGPWAPTGTNGFANATQDGSPFTTSVSGNGLVLTSDIATGGDPLHASFFLQNYNFTNLALPQLPHAIVSYDYSIALSSPTGSVYEFDDFGDSADYTSGSTITGHQTLDYFPGGANWYGGFFEYFGVNIDDGAGTASAVITLTNFSATVSEPASVWLLAIALLGLASLRYLFTCSVGNLAAH
jgi:hypothetical protein